METFLFFCEFNNIFTLYFGLNQLLRNKQKLQDYMSCIMHVGYELKIQSFHFTVYAYFLQ